MTVSAPLYRPHNPKQIPYYRCVEDHLETLEQVYEDRLERRYVFLRPHVKQVMGRYLDCGNLFNGFARSKCEDVDMNTYWPFPVNPVILAHPVIKREWSNLGNSYCMFPVTVIL